MIFSVITVFKMMCAGGTDCGANVWILEMWPGQDSWLQALHFSFAVGCALGPLIVEPFLSVEYKENEMDKIAGKTSGTTTINDQNNETRIHVPYGLSGLASIGAAIFILYLYTLEQRQKRQAAKLKAKQQAAAGEHILLTAVQHPAQLEAAGHNSCSGVLKEEDEEDYEQEEEEHNKDDDQPEGVMVVSARGDEQQPAKQVECNALSESAVFIPKCHTPTNDSNSAPTNCNSQDDKPTANNNNEQLSVVLVANNALSTQQPLLTPAAAAADSGQQQQHLPVKITSKAREQLVGRPPYYVMFAIALAAMCLSFYCGIEITSMNYLATFAVNIDLQLPKSTAALMSSALTISFAIGRGFGIWIAAYMKPHKLFYLCAGIMATGNVLMLIFANTAETLLWYSICLFGIGCGPMFPAIVSFYDDRISKVTNTVSGIFILGSMFNVALNSLIIGHHIIDNALILIVCNLIGSVLLLLLFGTLHMLTKVKKNQRVKKFKRKQQVVATAAAAATTTNTITSTTASTNTAQPNAISAAGTPDPSPPAASSPTSSSSESSAKLYPNLSGGSTASATNADESGQPTETTTTTTTTTNQQAIKQQQSPINNNNTTTPTIINDNVEAAN